LTVLAAMAGLLTLAACGEKADTIETPSAQPAAAAAPAERTLQDVTSKLPAGWPATEAMQEEAAAFPRHGSPWYPTPAADAEVDACLNRGYQGGIPQPC
jgi:hypothetical protein